MIATHPPAAVAAVLVLASFAGVAAAEERPWPAVFRETAEVRVVNVEVFVSDAGGRPVTGLTKEDFQLFEDGRPIEISNFYAVEGGSPVSFAAAPEAPAAASSEIVPPPEERQPRLVLFVDNENITAANRGRVFQRLREFVLENRRPELRTMVVSRERATAGRSLVVRQGFTSVAHEVFVALDELESALAGSHRLDADRRNLVRAIEGLNVDAASGIEGIKGNPDKSQEAVTAPLVHEIGALLPQLQAYSEQRYQDVRRSLGALARTVDMVAPLPGRKALVYVSDGLPLRPGGALFEGYADRIAKIGSLAAELSPRFEAARYDVTADVLELVGRANAGGVAFYALDASPAAPLLRGAAESQSAFRTSGMASFAEGESEDSLVLMAERTGGRAGLAAAALGATLEGVLTDFDHYYSLGYVVPPDAEGTARRDRSLEVKIRRPELRVRHRHSFRGKSPEELMTERVLAVLLLDRDDAAENPLDVTLGTDEPVPADDGHFVVPVLVEVPLGKLVLVPGQREHEARVSMYVAARDAAGRTSEVNRHLCPIRIPNSEVLLALGRTMVCGVRLLMREGEQHLAVAVRDEVAGVVSVGRFELEVAAPSESPR